MINPQNILRHEFIGLQVKVTQSSHNRLIGIKGKVIDETKKTIKIEDSNGEEKIIPKKVAVFRFKLPDGTEVDVEGRIITIRPEDRIKKRYKRY